MKKMLFCSLIAVIALACSYGSGSECKATNQFEEAVGKSAYAILKNPSSVTFYRVTPTDRRNYTLASEGEDLTDQKIKELSKMILCDSSYLFDIKKKCLFIPEAAYVFKNEKEVTVLVSVICKQIKVVSEEGEVVLDYDPVEDELSAFINNKELS